MRRGAGTRRCTITLDREAEEALNRLSRPGESAAATVRRALVTAASLDHALQPIREALDRIERRIAEVGVDRPPTGPGLAGHAVDTPPDVRRQVEVLVGSLQTWGDNE